MIKRIHNEEEGLVLVTSLIFLMIVTILAVTGLQSPKTDMMLSGNEKFINEARQLSNLGVMEAKNWLAVHYQNKSKPINYYDSGSGKVFVVSGDNKANPVNVDQNFGRIGKATCSNINFNGSNTMCHPGVPADGSKPTLRLSDQDGNNYDVGTYDWNIVRTTDITEDIVVSGAATESEILSYIGTLSSSLIINQKFRVKQPLSKDYHAELDRPKAFWQYFHIQGEGEANGVVAYSEAIVSYKEIISPPN